MLPTITPLKPEEMQMNNLKIFCCNPLFQCVDNLTSDFLCYLLLSQYQVMLESNLLHIKLFSWNLCYEDLRVK